MSGDVRQNVLLWLVLLLMNQSAAFASPKVRSDSDSAYAMRVDFNPATNKLAGLCWMNGHPRWFLLDTGWVGVALYPTSLGQPHHSRIRLGLASRGPLVFQAPVTILESSEHLQTSTGEPVVGIVGFPLMNLVPTEWNIPARKIVLWLRGRPRDFKRVPRHAIITCRRDSDHLLIVPVRVNGHAGEVCFDTGSDETYLFDSLISDFPAVGPEEEGTGPRLKFRYIPREVSGLQVGPLTLKGTVGGRLPARPTHDTVFPYGLLGMNFISRLHLFVTGDRIIFDPHQRGNLSKN